MLIACFECRLKIFANFQRQTLINFIYFKVQDLISNTQLNISSEEKVFTAVLNWIKHDLVERKKHIAELISNVRLPLLNREFLMENVETEPLVREDQHCKELLLEAMKYHLLPEQRSSLVSQRTLERKPEGMKPYVVRMNQKTHETFCALIFFFLSVRCRRRKFVCHSQRV